jgi:acyl-CoA thioester hydrolase
MTFVAGRAHIDMLGHVNNSVWVQWMEELATAHWRSHADPADVARWVWVASRHEIDYKGNVGLGRRVEGRTWIDTPPRGARFDRKISFVDADGRTLVAAKTSWAMLDAKTLRPARVPERLARQFLIEEEPSWPKR